MSIKMIANDCCGCSTCQSICPKNAITMEENEEGFLYPIVDDSMCVCCGKCLNVCPANRDDNIVPMIGVYAGYAKDQSIWANSTSGGAFVAICRVFGDENTYIAGAVFDSNNKKIEHRIFKGVSEATRFSGSKYVQSSIGNTFAEIKELLESGEKVIFSGTPCQVAGLNNILKGVDTTNLLTIALFCNGVGSNKVFRDYLKAIENKYNKEIVDYKFRDKSIVLGRHNLYRASAVFKDGSKISNGNDLYNSCYTQKIICRKSCYHCKYNVESIMCDILIGDFKKQYSIVKNAPYNRNSSVIVSKTNKGNQICSILDNEMRMYNVDEYAFDYPSNGQYNEEKRDSFFCDYLKQEGDVLDLLNRYVCTPNMVRKVWSYIPDKIRGRIKKIANR